MLAWLVQNMSTHGGEDIHGRWPGENNWTTVETRSLDKKHPEGGKEKELEKCMKHLLQVLLRSARTCMLEWWLSCCLKLSIHEHVLIFIKLDSEKEQDSQIICRWPASLAIMLSLFCKLPRRHDSKHFLMAIRNVSARMFARWATFDNNNVLQEWMHHVQ